MAEQSDGGSTTNFSSLEPFVHQVGGNSTMLKLNEISICKPFGVREHRFYEDLPSEMKAFTPQYRGVVYVSFEEDEEGFVNIISHPDKSAIEKRPLNPAYSCKDFEGFQHRVRLRGGKIELVDTRENRIFSASDEMTEQTQSEVNPWSLHLHKQKLSKLNKTPNIQKFIVLENIACQFTYPCVLDLKMGTRHHDDDTPNDKLSKIMAKVESSTSKTLGVRISGQQVYHQDLGRFICKNKHYGLKLSEEGFKRELTAFLHNGKRLRLELIEPFIHKLRKLSKVIEKLNSYRFYSSSLLLLYEGNETETSHRVRHESDCSEPMDSSDGFNIPTKNNSSSNHTGSRISKVEVRMIDFAHSTFSGCLQDNVRSGPDRGYLFGIENVISFLEDSFKKSLSEKDEIRIECGQYK